MKKLFLSIIVLLLGFSAFADQVWNCGYCGTSLDCIATDDVTATLTADTLTISGTGAMKNYAINSAPWYASHLSISRVVIEDGVTRIGSNAFYNCIYLTAVTVPNSVTSVGSRAFEGTDWLLNRVNEVVYAGKILYAYKGAAIPQTINIIDGTIGIADGAFQGRTVLRTVTIPNSVTNIGDYAFSGSGIISLAMPESVTNIGIGAFADCGSLNVVTIPNSVTSIGNYAFSGCSILPAVTIPNSVTNIGNHAFASSGLFAVDIPISVTNIGAGAFAGSALTAVNIPNSIMSIADSAFANCASLDTIIIPSGIIGIGRSAFLWNALRYIEIPSSVVSIGDSAFFREAGITTDIKVGWDDPSVVTYGVDAFQPSSIAPKVPAGVQFLYEITPPWSTFPHENITEYTRSTNATLSALAVRGYSLTPAFAPNIKEYALTVPSDVNRLIVDAIPAGWINRIEGTNIVLNFSGRDTFDVVVIAEDIAYYETYSIVVTRKVDMSDFSVSNGELSPPFHKDSMHYTLLLFCGDSSVTINAVAPLGGHVTHSVYPYTQSLFEVECKARITPVLIHVHSTDNSTFTDYTVNIIRPYDTTLVHRFGADVLAVYKPENYTGFQWTKNGEDIPNATRSYLYAPDAQPNDAFSVRLATSVGQIATCADMHLTPIPQANALSAYPNPVANGALTINGGEGDKVQIYNITGTLVKTLPRQPANGVTIDVAGLSSGIYIIKVGKQTTSVIVK